MEVVALKKVCTAFICFVRSKRHSVLLLKKQCKGDRFRTAMEGFFICHCIKGRIKGHAKFWLIMTCSVTLQCPSDLYIIEDDELFSLLIKLCC